MEPTPDMKCDQLQHQFNDLLHQQHLNVLRSCVLLFLAVCFGSLGAYVAMNQFFFEIFSWTRIIVAGICLVASGFAYWDTMKILKDRSLLDEMEKTVDALQANCNECDFCCSEDGENEQNPS